MTKSRFKPEDDITKDVIENFELIIGDAGGKIDNGDVPIRWCISKEYVESLEEQGIIDPHVLIASFGPTNKNKDGRYTKEMDRKMVPLTELMTYLRFTSAGNAKVYGIIIDGACGRGELHKKYMKIGWEGKSEIVNSYDDTIYDDLEFVVASTDNIVEIPANVFGKEPSKWMKWYVNLWHESSGKVVDECHYRRRLMMAFTLKWFPVMFFYIAVVLVRSFVAGVIKLSGWHKSVRFFRSFRPFKYPSFGLNVIDGDITISNNFFAFKRKSLHNKFDDSTGMMWAWAFTPILWIAMGFGILYFNPDGIIGFCILTAVPMSIILAAFIFIDMFVVVIELSMRYTWFEKLDNKVVDFVVWLKDNTVTKTGKSITVLIMLYIGYLLIEYLYAFIGLVAIWLVTMVILFGIILIFNRVIERWFMNMYTITADENDYSNIKALLCPREEDNLRPNIKYIPRNRRTIRLWYLNMKNKVCKPMQR